GVALLINSVLLYLVLWKSSKDIGNYRYLLFAFVFNDIFFTIIHAVTQPIACTYGDAFIIFATGVWSSLLSISYYAATFSQTMPLLMHLFIYRFIAMTMCWGSFYLYAPDPESLEYLKPFFVGEYAGFDYLAQLYW
ncbi:hypothetical protein PENTCL1PPCAC_16003, partial [Pristionchus entomophagus]